MGAVAPKTNKQTGSMLSKGHEGLQIMCPLFQSDFKRRTKVVTNFSKHVGNKFHKTDLVV